MSKLLEQTFGDLIQIVINIIVNNYVKIFFLNIFYLRVFIKIKKNKINLH